MGLGGGAGGGGAVVDVSVAQDQAIVLSGIRDWERKARKILILYCLVSKTEVRDDVMGVGMGV